MKPEQVNHYELGLKAQFLDRRATVNFSAFWTEIEDYQATVTNGQLRVLRGYLANAGKVRTRGIEIDSAFGPVSHLSLYANGACTDASYIRFVDAPCPPELAGGPAATALNPASPAATPGGFGPANGDISGQRLPGVSKWAFSYGAEYNLPIRIAATDSQFYIGYDDSYRSRFSSNPSRSIFTDVAGYLISNFRIGVKARNKWNVFGWVRNAFGQNYFDLLALQAGNTGLVVGQPGDPRTFGGTISTRF